MIGSILTTTFETWNPASMTFLTSSKLFIGSTTPGSILVPPKPVTVQCHTVLSLSSRSLLWKSSEWPLLTSTRPSTDPTLSIQLVSKHGSPKSVIPIFTVNFPFHMSLLTRMLPQLRNLSFMTFFAHAIAFFMLFHL